MLPQKFQTRMQHMLGEEYPAFSDRFQKEPHQALRINPLKVHRERFLSQTKFSLQSVPWCANGFYYEPDDRPGRHPYHHAGVYYIQEPSAMLPACCLDVHPGMRVLDLCGAPGGKSTQIAAAMDGEGILISNEIHAKRARILSENIERMGIRNAIVLNETPQHLARVFPAYFHRIMVDAPCSGEGMFRKNPDAVLEWSEENVVMCALRQDEILDTAYEMLMPGGKLVYSTCTFSPDENEGSISRFLARHEDMVLLPIKTTCGMTHGRPDWVEHPAHGLDHTVRLWPHKISGEGHFVAALQKKGRETDSLKTCSSDPKEETGISADSCGDFLRFCGETLKEFPQGIYLPFGDQLYLLPPGSPSLKGLKTLRPGLHLGTNKKNRFEPSHALAMAQSPRDVRHAASLGLSDPGNSADAYLNGQAIPWEGDKGWYLMTLDGYSLGWGKLTGSLMKNHYPKGLRRKII